jgi:hypothetical protein
MLLKIMTSLDATSLPVQGKSNGESNGEESQTVGFGAAKRGHGAAV